MEDKDKTDEAFMERLNDQEMDTDTSEAIQETLSRDTEPEPMPETSYDARGFGETLADDDQPERVDGDLEFRREEDRDDSAM